MNIVVLCGGISTEREISLRSSVKVAGALRGRGHKVRMIDIFFGAAHLPSFSDEQDFVKTVQELRALSADITEERIASTGLMGPNVLELCRKADIVFIGLHGANGEDGKVQAVFDREGIRYTGSGSESSRVAMSKAETKERVASQIPMPQGFVVRKGEKPPQEFPLPCVIKPSNGGSSVGVYRVVRCSEFLPSLNECFRYDDTVLVEEMIHGRELTQAVLDGRALPPVEICPDQGEWYDYTNKYSGFTRELCPAPIPQDVQDEMSRRSIRFGEILGLSVYYRIDYLLDEQGNLFALEANSLPGMTDTSLVPQEAAAAGMDYPSLCEKIVEISLNRYR